MLPVWVDKGYYDYEKLNESTEAALAERLNRIDFVIKPKKKTLTPEELQAEVMAEEK